MKTNKTSSVVSSDKAKPDLLKKKKSDKDYCLKGDLFWNVFNSSNNAILLICNSEIIDCNKNAFELFEAKREDIIGKTPFELSPETQPDGKNSTNKGKKLLENIIKKGVVDFEWVQRKISGEQFLAEISATSFETDGVQYVTATIRDITTYRKDQDELKNYRKNLEKLVDKQVEQLTEFNNELQAANEELDTSNEELQATNEELYSTNEALEHTNFSLHKEIEEHKKTQAEKAILEEKLKQFVSQSSEAIIIVNDKGIVEDWNETIAQITGITKKKALGKYMWDVTYMMTADPDKADFFRESFKNNTSLFFESVKQGNRKAQVSETLIRHHDSSQRYIHTTLFPIVTNSGNYGGVIISDITQKKAAEAQLEEYRAELEKLLQQKTERLEQLSLRFNEVYTNSSDAITFMDILDDGKSIKVFDMNPVSQKLFKKTPEQVARGIYINELLPEIKIESFINNVLPLLLKGQAITYTDDRDTGNGYWNSTIYPVKDEAGKIYRIAAFSRNVTAEHDKERFSAILNSAIESWPYEFWVCDEEGRCIIQNKASLKHWGDLTSMKPENLGVPDNLKEQTKDIASKALHSEYSSAEFTFEKDNNERSVLFNFNPIFSKNKVTGFLGLGIDITERKKNEKALYESEQRLQQLLASVTDYTITLNIENGKITAISHGEGCLTVTGYSTSEFYSNPFLWFNMVHDDDKPFITEWSQKVNRGIEVGPVEHRIIHKNGEVRWVNNTTVIKKNTDGSFAGFDGLITNITERKNAELALRESEKRFFDAIDFQPLPIAIALDQKPFLYNKSFIETFGYTIEDIPTIDEWIQKVVPIANQQEIMHTDLKKTMENNSNNFVNTYGKEFEIICKDGSKKWIEISDRKIGNMLITVFNDFTERRNAEAAIRESEERFRTILKLSGYAVFDLNLENQKCIWSGALEETSGYTIEEYNKLSLSEMINLLHPDDQSWFSSLFNESIAQLKPFSARYRIKTKKGIYIWVESDAFVFANKSNKAYRMLGIMKDITEKKQAEEQLLIKNFAIESSLSAIGLADLNGNLIYANDAYIKLWGFKDKNEVIEMNLADEDPWKNKVEEIIKSVKEKGYYSGEEATVRNDMTPLDIQVSINIVNTPDGKPVCIMASFIDITERKKVENENKRILDLHQSILDTTSVGLLYVVDRKMQWANNAFYKMFGYNFDEICNIDTSILYENKESYDRIGKEAYSLFKEGKLFSTEEIFSKRKDGTTFWLSLNGKAINPNDPMAGSIWMLQDNTERKKAELALRKSESILKSTLESMSDGILIVMSDNKISHVNTRFRQMFSIPDELLLSLDDWPVLDYATQQLINPKESYNRIVEIYKSENKTKDILNLKNGCIIERLSFPLTEDSPMKGRVWLFRDVTENKIAEEKLRNSENKFKTIFDNSKDGIILLDSDLKIIDLNKAVIAKSNYPYERLVGKKAIFFIANDKSAETNLRLESVWESKTISNFETELKIDELKTIPVEVSATKILLDNLDALLLIIRDITERKQLEKELLNIVIKTEEQERMHFSQELHDGLGPLLSATKMYVEWLEKPNANIKQTDIIPDIKKLINEASSTVRDISFKLSPHILQNYGVIEALNAYAEKVQISSNINIKINVLSFYRISEVVDTIIYRVLCECINNTLKHAKAQNIVINFCFDEKTAIIEYIDDGLGFDVEKAISNRKGVGLLNMQSRLKSINGAIIFNSNIDSGSHFIIKINVALN